MKLVLSLLLFALVGLVMGAPVGVVLDSDMANDCDDAGALAVLHGLADLGEVEILAVVTNRKDPSGASAAACAAINRYYGRPGIPIEGRLGGGAALFGGGQECPRSFGGRGLRPLSGNTIHQFSAVEGQVIACASIWR